jgi:hypothetical protein
MKRLSALGCQLSAVFLLGSGVAAAQEPARFANARVETRDASLLGGLEAALRSPAPSSSAPAWFAYAMRAPGERRIHTGDGGGDAWSWHGRCRLEGSSSYVNVSDGEGDEDGTTRVLFFYRVESGRPTRLRVFSDDCTVDAGGTSVIWLDGVRAAESVAYLEKLFPQAESGEKDRLSRERILMAIALHDDPAADAALERFAAPSQPHTVRKKAAFWLGNARGRRGYEVLKKMAASDPDEEVRKSVTFALSQSPVPEAVDALVSMARTDASSRVRSQALFWLAQKAGRRAAETITDAIRDDPETEVKRKAVFALTQLPSDESTTQLIHVARTNRNPEVRKQAMFWLGQSKDPRALAYIEEILTK